MKRSTIFTSLLLLICGAAFIFLMVSPLPAAISLRTNPLFFYPAAGLLAALVALNLLLILRHKRIERSSENTPMNFQNAGLRIASDFTKEYKEGK